MGQALLLLAGLLIVLLITALTAWFVAQEFAFMAVDRSRTTAQAAAGDKRSDQVLQVTGRTSFMLSGAQLGITVTGLVVGYAAEPLIGSALGNIGTSAGLSKGLAVGLGVALALVFSTVVQMVLGELFPKNYAIARPDAVARFLAPTTLAFLKIFKPFIWFFDRSAEGLLKLLGIEPVHDVEHSATVRDLKHIVEESRDSGELDEDFSDMLDRVLEFPQRPIGHAMIPRARVDTVQADTPIAEVRQLMEGGHTRYPVMEDDDPIGVVELLDVLTLPADDPREVRDIMRPAFKLSAFTLLPDALHEMREHRAPLALVIDEFGGFDGVLSTEDLAEEIVGEIEDEHDPDDLTAIAEDGDEGWVCPGGTPVDEVERALDIDMPPGDYESVGGAAMAFSGGFLDAGESVEIPLPVDPGEYASDHAPVHRVLIVDVVDLDNDVPHTVRLTLGVRELDETTEEH